MTTSFGDDVIFRHPTAEDGMAVFELINACPPLDSNSPYCNLLQCSHFSETSLAAFKGSRLVGFISGYLKPGQPETLFIWQVAISRQARRQRLASRMLTALLQQPSCREVHYLETTITPDNTASNALFQDLSRTLLTDLNRQVLFDREHHFKGHHDTENLIRLGPFQLNTLAVTPIHASTSSY